VTDGSAEGPERYTTQSVTFAQPFTLGNPPEIHPAGAYEVEAREQAFESNGRIAYVRTSTVLIIPTRTGIRCREVQASELDLALKQDAHHGGRLGPSENPDRGRADSLAVADGSQ
jgi:hypothetical protein